MTTTFCRSRLPTRKKTAPARPVHARSGDAAGAPSHARGAVRSGIRGSDTCGAVGNRSGSIPARPRRALRTGRSGVPAGSTFARAAEPAPATLPGGSGTARTEREEPSGAAAGRVRQVRESGIASASGDRAVRGSKPLPVRTGGFDADQRTNILWRRGDRRRSWRGRLVFRGSGNGADADRGGRKQDGSCCAERRREGRCGGLGKHRRSRPRPGKP